MTIPILYGNKTISSKRSVTEIIPKKNCPDCFGKGRIRSDRGTGFYNCRRCMVFTPYNAYEEISFYIMDKNWVAEFENGVVEWTGYTQRAHRLTVWRFLVKKYPKSKVNFKETS